MLVLSRRLNEKLLFPDSNTTIQVLHVNPGVVRLGIDAPPDVTVLRAEVPDRSADWRQPLPRHECVSDRWLKSASRSMGLLRLQLRAGRTKEAEAALDHMHQEIQAMRRRIAADKSSLPATAALESTAPWQARELLTSRNDDWVL